MGATNAVIRVPMFYDDFHECCGCCVGDFDVVATNLGYDEVGAVGGEEVEGEREGVVEG